MTRFEIALSMVALSLHACASSTEGEGPTAQTNTVGRGGGAVGSHDTPAPEIVAGGRPPEDSHEGDAGDAAEDAGTIGEADQPASDAQSPGVAGERNVHDAEAGVDNTEVEDADGLANAQDDPEAGTADSTNAEGTSEGGTEGFEDYGTETGVADDPRQPQSSTTTPVSMAVNTTEGGTCEGSRGCGWGNDREIDVCLSMFGCEYLYIATTPPQVSCFNFPGFCSDGACPCSTFTTEEACASQYGCHWELPEPPPDPALPAGSYRESCEDVNVSGDTLRARCANDRRWVTTELEGYQDCLGDIANIRGTLFCDKGDGVTEPMTATIRWFHKTYFSGDDHWRTFTGDEGDGRCLPMVHSDKLRSIQIWGPPHMVLELYTERDCSTRHTWGRVTVGDGGHVQLPRVSRDGPQEISGGSYTLHLLGEQMPGEASAYKVRWP